MAGPRAALAELKFLDSDPAGSARPMPTASRSGAVFRLRPATWTRPSATSPPALVVSRGDTSSSGRRARLLPGAGPVPGRGVGRCAAPPSRRSGRASTAVDMSCRFCIWRRAACPGRGAAAEAERNAALAGEAAASLDYGQERLYAAMARALVCQASGDYLGMADAFGPWRDDSVLDGRSRAYALLWRPLLAEGLIGSGQTGPAAAVLDQLRAGGGEVGYLSPALAWLDGGWPNSAATRRRRCGSTPAVRTPPIRKARFTPPGCCWPMAAAAPYRQQEGRGRAATASERPVPGAARRAVHRPDRRGAGGL